MVQGRGADVLQPPRQCGQPGVFMPTEWNLSFGFDPENDCRPAWSGGGVPIWWTDPPEQYDLEGAGQSNGCFFLVVDPYVGHFMHYECPFAGVVRSDFFDPPGRHRLAGWRGGFDLFILAVHCFEPTRVANNMGQGWLCPPERLHLGLEGLTLIYCVLDPCYPFSLTIILTRGPG